MKKILSLLFPLTILISGCSLEEMQEQQMNLQDGRLFKSSFEQNETRTYVENGNLLRWNAGDQITIFEGNTLNRKYQFDGETGDNAGTFSIVSKPFGTGNDLNCHYAVYPYASNIKITEDGAITATLPSEQSYAYDSFGLGANTMVAVTKDLDDTFLKFKNVCGYLKLQLYGTNITVKSIVLTGNDNEKLAGKATITTDHILQPAATIVNDASTSLTLDCGDGVKIGPTAENATTFWITVPPTIFKSGFTVTITDINGKTFSKSTSKEISIERNVIQPMKAFEVELKGDPIPENQIWYISTDGKIVVPYSNNGFGASFISNTYENGLGVITFDGAVTSIGKNAFMYCSNLESVILPNTVTYISGNAFYDTSLESVLIPENVISIGEQAFASCDKLQSISLPDGLKSIGKYAFGSCRNLSDIVLPGEMTVIEEGMFYGCSSVTNINLPKNITTIGAYSFHGTSVTNITIPNKVVSIGNSAFNGCNLVNLTIPASVTSIGYNAFEGSSGELIVNCNIPSGQSVSNRPFYNTNFTKITIGDAVTSIGRLAFYGCTSLTSLTIGKNVTKIGEKAFLGTNITSLDIPDSVTSMGESAFSGCTLLKELTIGGGLTKIPTYAFQRCGFIDVIIPDNVNTIGQYAFYNCAELTSVAIPDSVTTIEKGAFNNCSSLLSVDIPSSVTIIEASTFDSCSALSSVTIPNSVNTISVYAFRACVSLPRVTIPENVQYLGAMAFIECSALTRVDVMAVSPPIVDGNPFQDSSSDLLIYVPSGSLNAYKEAQYWKMWNNVVEMSAEDVNSSNDYIDEYGINHGKGTEIDGVTWAPVNCGYHETDYKYGKLYQWGRKYGQSHDDTEVEVVQGPVSSEEGQMESNTNKHFYLTNPQKFHWDANNSYTLWPSEENDPCPDGWHVPSNSDLTTLSKNFSAPSTHNGQNGFWFSGTTNYSSSAPQIFLPAAGYRQGHSYPIYQFQNEVGIYWSCSGSEHNDGAKVLDIRYNGDDDEQVMIDRYAPCSAYSVRCVKN